MNNLRIAAAVLLAAVPVAIGATDFTVTGASGSGATRYVRVATGDVDGDGVLKLACSGGAISGSWLYAPRDSSSGMASGKRMHKPFAIVKEWGPAPPMLSAMKGGYDLKMNKTARVAGTMAIDDWQAVSVSGLDGACALDRAPAASN
ncbi:hypothetical protein [Sphingomonas sp.]|uniref:hypothetical protein n=1 Tax=Sphingomonas sp. TaxID=28214 RepID=UPI00286BF16B|nr:hypothetical protein [Sphingomonas sp.]